VTSEDDTLYAMDVSRSRGVLTTVVTGASLYGGPAVSDGVLYLNSIAGNITAFSLLAGTDARPSARAPTLSTLHPDMSLGVTPQRNIAWDDSDDE
jgi:hypothetical protein